MIRAVRRASRRGVRGVRLPTKRVAKANHVGAARVEARRGGGTAEPPTLDESLKKLMLRVHPDKYGQHPEARTTNDASLKRLNSFLQSLRRSPSDESSTTEHPAAGVHSMPFYVRDDGGALRKETLEIRTTGGSAKKPIERALGPFFERVGLDPRFTWNEGYFEAITLDQWRELRVREMAKEKREKEAE